MTETAGGGLFKGVHLELVAVVVGFLRSYVRSRTERGQNHRAEVRRGQHGESLVVV